MTNHQTVNSITHSAPDSASHAETAVKPPVSTNRREVLKMTSAALAIPTVAVGSFIPSALQSNPASANEEKLLALVDELMEIGRKQDENWSAWKELNEKVEKAYPALPEITRATKQDLEVFRFPPPTEGFRKRVTHYTPFMRNELAQLELTRSIEISVKKWLELNKGSPKISGTEMDDVVVRFVPWPEAKRRRDAIVAGIDKWIKQCRTIEKRMGLTTIETTGDQLDERYSDVMDQVEALPADSAVALVAKANAIGTIHRGKKAVEFGTATDHRLACQIINLLLKIDLGRLNA